MWTSTFFLIGIFCLTCSHKLEKNGARSLAKRSASGCHYAKHESMYFYGPIFKKLEAIENDEQCVLQCWQSSSSARRCLAANYLQKSKRCELMSQIFSVANPSMVKYFGDKNPESVYLVPTSCSTTGEGGGGETSADFVKGSCGQTSIDPMARSATRIVGGSEAKPHSHPWIVSLRQGTMKRHFCGGTLIRVGDADESDIVVTAAHCDEQLWKDELDIVLSAHDLLKPFPGEIVALHDKFVSHEQYDEMTKDHDIAIIKLEKPVKFSKTIQPACLPEVGEQLADGTRGLVAGWGNTVEGSSLGVQLQQLVIPVINTQQCVEFYKTGDKPKNINEKIMMCAGFPEGGKDSCQGDSGGPLVFKSAQGSYVLQGVVSFGTGCGKKEKPGVYTRVSEHVDWIKAKINEHSAVAKSK